ncbi:MAG TPA: pilus assembly protein N-terminal domain-containing protein, partial [Gemmataceae bacterium]|nr:pilus assembly protein N-terminal domain-containing protein [Gemmataceae bacterium]
MKTDGRSPTPSTVFSLAGPDRQSRSFRKGATVAVGALGSLALLLAVVHAQERAPSPMAISPPPAILTPADTGWTFPPQNPPPTAALTKQAVAPVTSASAPVRREIMRASYQEEVVPVQQAPTTPNYAPTPWRQQARPAAAPAPAPLPSTLPQSALQVRPLAPTEYMVAQAQTEPPANPPAKVPGKGPETMPVPRPAGPFGPDQTRLPRIADVDTPLGRTPTPTAKDVEDYNAAVNHMVDPHLVLDLVKDRVRIMQLKMRPLRTQIGDANIVEYNFIGQKALDIAFIGKEVGTTVFNVWFEDPSDRTKEKILSFLVRVIPDPDARLRLEHVYKQLEREINCQFPNSVVCLKLVGDKVCVSGQAYDIGEATKILQLVAASSPNYQQNRSRRAQNREKFDPSKIPVAAVGVNGIPGLDDYLVSPDSDIINQLRVGGEQQVMLRVTVAEVNRSAARSIGVNFSIMNSAGNQVFANQTGQLGLPGALNGIGAVNGIGNTTTALANLPMSLDNGRINVAINALRTLN